MTTITAIRPAPSLTRAVWIDRLRAGLILLVILHHAAITYGASGSWLFKATEATSIPLTFLAAVNQAFFMGLFFMLSGALAPRSLDRKGAAAFLSERVLRLGLPVLMFGFVLGPLTAALASAPPGDILAETGRRILQASFILGPLWFPAALLVFSIVLTVWPGHVGETRPVPPFVNWFGLALLTGLAALAIRQVVPVGATVAGFQLGYFASYVVLFVVGVQAGRNGWLDRLPARSLWRSMAVGLATLPVLPAVLLSTDAPRFETGFSLAAISYAFWEPLVALGTIAALVHWTQRSGDRVKVFWTRAAANSYGAFILHAPILVAASRALDGTGVPHGVALPVSVVATALAAFGLTALSRRSALVRRVV
ncbi:acyltransferase [Roseibacterium sp. SDUM158017]|uniref:acyltransferase family protein n=1 Tax=Roseicyclus salinarum TaxID=3036773 RepID=UPI0024151104|nr:acyltransferase [Roseibacterium sp. SDUM158017]MDG4650378.1 acyltransferase [Roseibacterium sp. SDUM158017]